jgi:hypothetical protein
MLNPGRLAEVYEAWDLDMFILAAICHETNHQGSNNVVNVKAETPLGIPYQDRSVIEIHHVTQTIPVVSRDDIALFHVFEVQQSQKVRALFIRIILSTDMAHHLELVKKRQAELDQRSFDMVNPEFAQFALLLIMKIGDISNVSRLFELADQWCDMLNEELFYEADLEQETGIGLASALNDRETANTPKSQIGF